MRIKHLLWLIFISILLYLDYLWYVVSDENLIIIWLGINFMIFCWLLLLGIHELNKYIKNNEFPKIKRFLNFKLF